MRCKTQTVPILLVALFLVISVAIVGYSVSANETTEDKGFVLEDWSVDQKLVQPGEKVKIEGRIENQGTDGDDESVILKVEGEQVNKTEEFVEPGESREISFLHSENDEGTYSVSVELGSSDDRWDEGEFKVELVTSVEIVEPKDDQIIITAGENLSFSAEAYSGEDKNDPKTDDSIFTWENTEETGLFNTREAGEYEVSATYNGVSSETVLVTVEPAEAAQLKVIEKPSENTIPAGNTAEFSVEIQDRFGNNQKNGSFDVALEVEGLDPLRRHSTTIEDGESTALLDWSTTEGKQGEYKIRVVNDNGILDSDEVTLTITEKEDSSMAVQWWAFPLAISVIAVISLIYLWDADKIYFSLGKKTNPTTHEWKKNKGSDEPSEETEELDLPDEDVKRGLD
ncbi:MAG: hypothetical protein KGY66_07240 [Candidatus Thermoplasmatota archaeon]|nr:hypothetical protein [Candidatus Thermoplasmatota archaeon]MBS3790694.1 hypothetical protein [Candidatus Thermoplasmatota archaeon]